MEKNITDSKGRPVGYWEKSFYNGEIHSCGCYDTNNRKIGLWTHYHSIVKGWLVDHVYAKKIITAYRYYIK